jgi:hypothetical protein
MHLAVLRFVTRQYDSNEGSIPCLLTRALTTINFIPYRITVPQGYSLLRVMY